ncbi:ABC transporter ATP-binding protein [Paenibacillus sp. GCM10012307]|uniref:ABC transporter ATP-binding protein n=1 Tax=Paenibacillus roseus TaxID=2798579 RepID=A0A934J9D6_9BACL|nr:ABC transporter ATP-binding protein [Paenibacillus roseus]MBJ6363978.1 ABC transporter ATP-binding protein [Paenibacillus roseus]
MTDIVIETKGLTKTIGGRNVVDKLDLKIKRGEIYGFLGPNGAGKTTTIRMLLGLTKPSSGEVRLFGKSIGKERVALLRKVGSLVEYPSYYGHLNAIENLETIRLLLPGVKKSRIDEVLSIVRLTKDAKRMVKGYSLGMKQRLGIAAALLGEPELLILDEPTNGLDPSGIIEIRELIRSMPARYGLTVLLSSHLLSEVGQMATEVGIVTKGKLIFQDQLEVLKGRSKQQIHIGLDDRQRALSLLHANGFKAELSGGSLYVPQGDDKRIAAIVRMLVQQGLEVSRVEEQGDSLESVFLHMTGGEGEL